MLGAATSTKSGQSLAALYFSFAAKAAPAINAVLNAN
jgi:hypothetical protein